MLVDEVEITIKAGDGGNGAVHFHHEKFKYKGGPDGGQGGDGGDLYFRAVSDLSALSRYRFQKNFEAQSGKPGGPNKMAGVSGEDLTIIAPVGTLITDLDTNESWELLEPEQILKIARGGKGGLGNWSFRSSTNQVPMEFGPGTPGQARRLQLELLLIADIGLVGLPSVGKSSLLNELTNASAKVGAYHFTTLEPNLGEMDGLIIADLPGLIEGASVGRGLGDKFLRHITRTRVIVHCVAADSADPLADYRTIRTELADYSADLVTKKELVLLTRTDLVTPAAVKKATSKLKKINPAIITVSIHDYDSLISLKSQLLKLLHS